MQPVNLGGLAEYLGPGTGGLWMGEQQRNAMQESELNQRKGLEDILTAQQNREFAAQKNPLELEQLRNTNAMFPAKQEELNLKNQESKAKISRQAYQDYLDDLAKTPMGGSLEDKLTYVNDTNKKHKMDPESPMSMIAVKSLQDPQAWQKLWDGVAMGGQDARAKSVLQEQSGAARLAQEQEQQRGGIKRAEIAADASRYAADQRVAAAAARQKQAADVYQAAITGKLPYEKAAVALTMMAEQAEDPQEKARLQALAADMEQRNLNQKNAQNRGGGMELSPQGGITNRPPQEVVPQRGAAVPQPAAPQAGPRQLSPQDQQAAAWAQANPNDPRAAAIRQKLGL